MPFPQILLSFFESLLPHSPFLLVLLLSPLLVGFVCESNITARQRKKKKERRETLKRASRASSGHARGPQAKHAKGTTHVGRKTDKKLKYEKRRQHCEPSHTDTAVIECNVSPSASNSRLLTGFATHRTKRPGDGWEGERERKKKKKRSAVFESPPFPLSHSTDLFFTVQRIKRGKKRDKHGGGKKNEMGGDNKKKEERVYVRMCVCVCVCVCVYTHPTLSTAAAHFLVRSPWSLSRNEREAHLKQQQKGEKWVRKGCRTRQT